MENLIYHRDFEGLVVNLVNSSAVAQAKPSRSGFDPFERRLFCPFLIFKDCVFPSVIVNDFKFAYRLDFGFHNGSTILRLQLRWPVDLENPATLIGLCCRCQRIGRSRALYRRHERSLLRLVRVPRAALLLLRGRFSKTNPRTLRLIAYS